VGLELDALAAATHQPELTAYGSVHENPDQTFTLRAPVAGTIVSASSGNWPGLGKVLPGGAEVGGLMPRLGPVERVDLESKLADARADAEDARASLVALRASLESKRQLNAERKIVSDQVLQEAEAKVKGEAARLRAAEETVKTLEQSMSAASRPADTIPLTVVRPGRVVEVIAHPGESVESGQALLRISSFHRMLAQVSLPVGQSLPQIASASVIVAGFEQHPFSVQESLPAPAVDPITGGQTFLFEFASDGLGIQPGMAVTARLSMPGQPQAGVMVPSPAVIRYAGAGWVYSASGQESFTRREIPLNHPTPEGWFVAEGLVPGTPVVVQAAQVLLSKELKFQEGGGEEEEE
jgi:biotin carboxyl carrier protein